MLTVLLLLAPHAAPPADAERLALDYLARRVPLWARENRCYSCHHNGDAARALYVGRRFAPLADTTRWLCRPGGWDRNGGDGPFSDRRLARLQFAVALGEAKAAGQADDRAAFAAAAGLLRAEQGRDGSWRVVEGGTLGAATTYGNAVATALARQALGRLDPAGARVSIALADRWLRGVKVVTVLDAAGVLLGLGAASDDAAVAQRRRCLDLIRRGESDGGWGPYVNSPPEVFDTAAVVLALSAQERTAEITSWLRRGRAFLRAAQQADGSWAETTRPSGAVSYPQRLSTSGWAALALLATRR